MKRFHLKLSGAIDQDGSIGIIAASCESSSSCPASDNSEMKRLHLKLSGAIDQDDSIGIIAASCESSSFSHTLAQKCDNVDELLGKAKDNNNALTHELGKRGCN